MCACLYVHACIQEKNELLVRDQANGNNNIQIANKEIKIANNKIKIANNKIKIANNKIKIANNEIKATITTISICAGEERADGRQGGARAAGSAG